MQKGVKFVAVLGLAAVLLALLAREAAQCAAPAATGAEAAGEPLAIIVNRSNNVDVLSTVELRRIFLGQRSHWPNGRRITLVMREPGEPERKCMLHDLYQMSESDLKNHFLHGLFTGDILVSPKILATAVGVRKFVFNVPGAIGYVRLSDVDNTVKVVRVDELLPDDKGYRLKVEIAGAKQDARAKEN
jgi:ABC-type phosphate transport system substrate-binding protein